MLNKTNEMYQRQTNEVYQCIIGRKFCGWFIGRALNKPIQGSPCLVKFNSEEVLSREESHGDVIGFYHTHPNMKNYPSGIDYSTMEGWITCFGRPLLCSIEGSNGLAGYWYYENRPHPDTMLRPQTLWIKKWGDWFIGKAMTIR